MDLSFYTYCMALRENRMIEKHSETHPPTQFTLTCTPAPVILPHSCTLPIYSELHSSHAIRSTPHPKVHPASVNYPSNTQQSLISLPFGSTPDCSDFVSLMCTSQLAPTSSLTTASTCHCDSVCGVIKGGEGPAAQSGWARSNNEVL